MPPIEFQKMLSGLNIDNSLIKKIDELISLKSTISESYLHSGEVELINFIETCINTADEKRNSLASSKGNTEELNSFFLKIIAQNDN